MLMNTIAKNAQPNAAIRRKKVGINIPDSYPLVCGADHVKHDERVDIP